MQRAGSRNRFDALSTAFDAVGGEDTLARMFAVDALTQLPDDLLMLTDKMTMANSLECRVPLLDHELVELAARIPANIKVAGGEMKALMKKALADVLPREVLHRPKRGFGAPMGAWLKNELAQLLSGALSRAVDRAAGIAAPRANRATDRCAPRQPHRRYRPPAGVAEPRSLESRLPGPPRVRRCRR